MGTRLRVLSESFPMNTNLTGLRWFFRKKIHPCASDESSLNIERVKVGSHCKERAMHGHVDNILGNTSKAVKLSILQGLTVDTKTSFISFMVLVLKNVPCWAIKLHSL